MAAAVPAGCSLLINPGTTVARELLRHRGLVDEPAAAFIRQFRVDIGLIGISGIGADGTLRDFDPQEVMVARTIIEQLRQVWLVADHSKFDRPAMVALAGLEQVDCLLAETGVDCVVAG